MSHGTLPPPRPLQPVVDLTRFPDLLSMTTYAHNLSLTAGWYGNK